MARSSSRTWSSGSLSAVASAISVAQPLEADSSSGVAGGGRDQHDCHERRRGERRVASHPVMLTHSSSRCQSPRLEPVTPRGSDRRRPGIVRSTPAILRSAGDVAEWLRQRPAKPSTRVRFPPSPPVQGLPIRTGALAVVRARVDRAGGSTRSPTTTAIEAASMLDRLLDARCDTAESPARSGRCPVSRTSTATSAHRARPSSIASRRRAPGRLIR